MQENKESKAKRLLVVGFLLIIVLVSAVILVSLYKKEAGNVGTNPIIRTQ